MAVLLACFAMWSVKVEAADFYWDADAAVTGNNVDGTGLGGTGAWNLVTANWWDAAGMTMEAWPNTDADNAIFTYAFPTSPYAIPTPFTVNLGEAITANRLTFQRSGYTITGIPSPLMAPPLGSTPTLVRVRPSQASWVAPTA